MLARATFRAASAPTLVARRGFQSTRAQMSSPYHYPEGPRSNLPFDPLKRGFAFKYWGFMGEMHHAPMATHELTAPATGFGLPFALAGEMTCSKLCLCGLVLTRAVLQSGRQRRTSRRCTEHGCGSVPLGACGICRILQGPRTIILEITASVSLPAINIVSRVYHAVNAYVPRMAATACYYWRREEDISM
jgi:cytochrome c oxidase subunit 7c